MKALNRVKQLLRHLHGQRQLTHSDGYFAASGYLLSGECPEELKAQAMSDLRPDEFTKGWLAAIKDFK